MLKNTLQQTPQQLSLATKRKKSKQINTPENYKERNKEAETIADKTCSSDDEITLLKQPFQQEQSSANEPQLSLPDDDTSLDDNNEQSQKNQEKEAEYRTCKNELEIQKKLNKELQQRLRELMSESKLLKSENERLHIKSKVMN